MKNIITFVLSICLGLSFSCTHVGDRQDEQKHSLYPIEFEKMDTTGSRKVYYRFPAPNDIIRYIQSEKLEYNREFLNPRSNADKYLDSRLQLFNLGVFIADIGYITLFNNLREASGYFEVTEKLAYEVGVSAVFNEAFRNRIQKNASNMDSLSNLARIAYNRLVEHLMATGNERQLAIISAGGYTEVLYLASMQVKDASMEEELVKKVYDQKYGLENLIYYMQDYVDDEWVYGLQQDLNKILDAFMSPDKSTQPEAVTSTRQDDGSFTFAGSPKTVSKITPEEFTLLLSTIKSVREKYIDPY